ncbi:MAG TPA: DNA-directed RNA polymerase subunit omega [Acidisarcina sp.]
MRSDLVYSAAEKLPNRFTLCLTVARAARKLHIPSTATEVTINKVLSGIAAGEFGRAGEMLPAEEAVEIRKAVKRHRAISAETEAQAA